MYFIKKLQRQIKSNTISTMFVILGYSISLLLVSLGTSYALIMSQQDNMRDNAMPENAIGTLIKWYSNKDMYSILSTFKNISIDGGVLISGIYADLDSSDGSVLFPVSAEFFHRNTGLYPIVEGRYYTANEIAQNKRVALLGRGLKKYTETRNGKTYTKIFGEEFEVVGIIGKKGTTTPWEVRISIPVGSIPETCIDMLMYEHNMSSYIYNEKNNANLEIERVKMALKGINPKIEVDTNPSKHKSNLITFLFSGSTVVLLALFVLMLSLINSVLITLCWISQRGYEIGVRKAFGQTNYQLGKLIFTDMLILIFLSSVISILLEFLSIKFISSNIKVSSFLFGSNINFAPKMFIGNFIVSIIFVLLITLLTSLPQFIKAVRIQPIEALKL